MVLPMLYLRQFPLVRIDVDVQVQLPIKHSEFATVVLH